MDFLENWYDADDGLSLCYREYGVGDDVVLCLHGLTRNCKDFDGLARHLASRRRVICPDMRGRGQSDRDPKPRRYNPGTYVRDVWRLLDRLSIPQVAVIGTSMGGLMAMIMADQRPDRLHSVVLNDIGPEVPPEAVARISGYVKDSPSFPNWPAATAQVQRVYEAALPDMPDQFWQDYASLNYREDDRGAIVPDYDPAIGATAAGSGGLLAAIRWLRRFGVVHRIGGVPVDPWDGFRAMIMPTLVIRGENSDVLTPDVLRRMQEVHPALRVAEIPKRGHAPLLNEPEAVEAIDAHLDGAKC